MNKFYKSIATLFLFFTLFSYAQDNVYQLPNDQFEDWTGDSFDGVAQPASWNYSNVTQFGYKFNFAHKETGRSGSCLLIQDQDLEVAGIGETSPGYVSLGHSWVYIESLTKVKEATAGTYGGITWTHRPDTLVAWIKRTGGNAMKEDFHIVYYSWSGTARGDKYKGKNGQCTSVSQVDEESDIRQSTDGNECGTSQFAHQVAEGWTYGRAVYNDWTQIKIPIYYNDNTIPEKMNVIFSASNYPNFRANSGLYAGNSLYVDDVELIYSSKIQQLYIDGTEWTGFDPNSEEVQYYTLNENATAIPAIKAYRGAGQLTNSKGNATNFLGRQLQGKEIAITSGEIDNTPTTITVKSEDGKSVTKYQIQFVHKSSNNAYLNGIMCNGSNIKNFNPYITEYTIDVPFGTTEVPTITCTKQDDQQSVSITPASSLSDKTIIVVTAPDKQTKLTYTIQFRTAVLSDNTLQGIKVNGTLISNFEPTRTNYQVSIPIGTTQMPTVEAISAYAAGQQTIKMTAPAQIENGVYQIAVSSPGNPTPLVYRLTFKMELSSNCSLQGIFLDGTLISNFSADITTYQVALPAGTTTLPKITYTKADANQKVDITTNGIDGVTRITVTAANGDTRYYKIEFSTIKSDISTLSNILVDGEPIADFNPNVTSYVIQLPIGTSTLPTIEAVKADELETVSIKVDEIKNLCRIIVSANNGSTTVYQITFQISQSANATLDGILVDSLPLPNFHPDTLEYYYSLPIGTTNLPLIEYIAHDEYQSITTRAGGVNGDYKIIVRPQSGSSLTYIIHFSVQKATNTALENIFVDQQPIPNFHPDTLQYSDTLESDYVPAISYQSTTGQKVIIYLEDNTYSIKVTSESGATRIYTYSFFVRKSENAFLQMIYLDGDSLTNFQPEQLSYSNLILKSDVCPTITVGHSLDQQVSILSPAGAGTAKIIVTAGAGNSNTYLLHFIDTTIVPVQPLEPDPEYILSTDVALSDIRLDGVSIANFNATQHTYSIQLPAGSEMPTVTFIPHSEKQSLLTGRTQVGTYEAYVTAENGDTAKYVVQIEIEPYDNVQLQNLQVDGMNLVFDPETTTYQFTLEEGQALPKVSYTANEGQTIMMYTPNANQQAIIVTAQSGRQNTYYTTYTRELSQSALLRDILVGDSSIFVPDQFDYTYPLKRHTMFVPVVNAIGTNNQQTITTYFSAVNGTTRIHVEAADGITTSDYTITFPVELSSNVSLGDLRISSAESTYILNQIEFSAEQTEYNVTLPYYAILSPTIKYDKSEPEQQISFTARPIGQANEITVRAENGDTRTYTITFQKADKPQNILKYISLVMQKDSTTWQDTIHFTNDSIQEYTLDLPYGTSNISIINIEKNYYEQSVMVQPGGIHQPTILTVYATNEDQQPTVYTISPKVAAYSALLTDINVNGVTIDGFTPDRFSYIVDVTEKPIIRYTLAQGATINVLEQTSKHWKAEVKCDGHANTYDVWYYYPEEVIPNGEFTEWIDTRYDAQKPKGWNVIADHVDAMMTTIPIINKEIVWYAPGNEVSKESPDIVHLDTKYEEAPGGMIPAFITLGAVSGTLGVAGSSSFQVNGGINFHNTPDIMSVRYKAPKISTNNRILYQLTGNEGYKEIKYTDTKKVSDYTILDLDLSDANKVVGAPTLMNIILNSYHIESGTIAASDADMYVDWVRFSYNNTLSKIFVNGKEAEKDKNSFSFTLSSSTDDALPQLRFVGEVSDQAQKVDWAEPVEEGEYSIRRASITNYGEDGKSSAYTLEVKRPLDTNASLRDLLIDGNRMTDWNPDQLTYHYQLPYGTISWPDVKPELTNNMQRCTTTYSDSTVTIQVLPETGEAKIYTIHFVIDEANDATPLNIQTKNNSISFDPLQLEYTIQSDTMPEIYITKRYDVQNITIEDGVIQVSMDNEHKQQYKIQLQRSVVTTSGQLSQIELDNKSLADFAASTYSYTQQIPELMSFTRQDATDSVVFVRQPDMLQWQVFGTQQHTYQLTAPTILSGNTALQGIYVNSTLVDGFVADITDYTIYTDSAVQLSVVADEDQQIDIQVNQGTYTISVTAEDGTVGSNPYQVVLSPTMSANDNLTAIYINGLLLPGFRPDSTYYTYEVPVSEYKDHDSSLPSISYTTSDAKAIVEIEQGQFGEMTNLRVTAPNGDFTNYQILLTAEKSHNASLSAIAINNVLLADFDPERTYYSVQLPSKDITLEYRSKDRYQTITQSINENLYIIHVEAEDGVSEKNYIIQAYIQSPSNDATLAHIYLDGDKLENFYPELNSGLYYNPNMNRYMIYIPQNLPSLPNVSIISKTDGQNITTRQEENTISIDVIAPDSITTNTYSLLFVSNLSSNTALKMIYLNGDTLENYNGQQLHYIIDLPTGQHELPEIDPVKLETAQQLQTDTTQLAMGQQVSIHVTAEDGTTQARYILTFQMYPYESDTLPLLYDSNHDTLPGFQPHQYDYLYEMPYDTLAFPDIDWEVADDYQVVTVDTAVNTDLQRTYHVHVTAESGLHNIYSITYKKLLSNNTSLEMIYVNKKQLADYSATTKEYVYTLAIGESIDTIYWDLGDDYQQVAYTDSAANLVSSIVSTHQIHVTAQNGDTCTYTIHFTQAPSTNSTLGMIFSNGQPLDNYDSELFTYSIQLKKGETLWPAITYNKQDSEQDVNISYNETNNTITIMVTAADHQTQSTYQLTCLPYLSDNALLAAIYLNNALIEDFESTKFIYEHTIDSVAHLPVLTYTLSESTQSINMDTTYVFTEDSLLRDIQYQLTVTSENQSNTEYYQVTIHIDENMPKRPEDSDNALLKWLGVNGQLISTAIGFTTNFDAQTLEYYMYYPIGSDPDLFFTDSVVMAIPQDSLAQVKAKNCEIILHEATHIPYKSNIRITVQAANGNSQTYQIYQELLLDSLNHVTQLNVADNTDSLREIPNFNKEVYYYEYVLSETCNNAPAVELLFDNTDSRYASVSFERDNDFRIVDADDMTNYEFVEGADDPTYHICYRAENGTRYVYKIKFRRSEVKRAQKPMEGDVLIQHIPGSYQIAVASLRTNVTFALYDIHGSMVELVQLPETDPNSMNIITDGFGQTYFGNVSDYSSCTILTLTPNKVYFWVFTENGKRKIKSGKLAIIP